MNTELAKRPASFMREHTRPVRDHAAAMARLTDQYVAALSRAQAQYFDGVKRITDAVTADAADTEPATTAETSEPATVEPSP